VLTLTYLPRLLDILPLYLILLGIAPLLILTVKRDYRIVLLISGAVYVTIWFSGWNLKAGEGRDWYFDPFAWQFLYTLGMRKPAGARPRLPTLSAASTPSWARTQGANLRGAETSLDEKADATNLSTDTRISPRHAGGSLLRAALREVS
jgi:hypothetical protein